jgi:hypothetical protein
MGLSKAKVVNELHKAQRCALTSTSTAYRTVSHAALCVLTGTMSIHIRTRWLRRIFEIKKLVRPNSEDQKVFFNQLELYEEEAVEEWRGDGLSIGHKIERGGWSRMQPPFERGREASSYSPCSC